MPMAYSDELKQRALDLSAKIGATAAAKELNVSGASVRNWIRQARDAEPKRFSPEFKELAVERAAIYGSARAAEMMSVSGRAVRHWMKLKKEYGSASAPDPSKRRKKEKEACLEVPYEMIRPAVVSAGDWARALYDIYARDGAAADYELFVSRLNLYAALLQNESRRGDEGETDGENDRR